MAIVTSRRLAGISSISIDGSAYDVVGDLKWSPSQVKRETMKGLTRVEGFSEMPMEGFIEATLRDNAAFSVKNFNTLTNSTVLVQQANGKSILGVGMWCSEPQEVNAADATFKVRFESDDVGEVGSVNA